MNSVQLGLFGPRVSEVCFGSLAISPLQGRVTQDEAVAIMEYAFKCGIDWIDTAEIYDNYHLLAKALHNFPEVKVVSKSYAVSAEEMKQSIALACTELKRDAIDFFLLHEQESAMTLKGHQGAWEELLRAKQDGRVRYIGISTHAAAAVKAAALLPGIDVIHPLINYQGLGIIDGTLEDMLAAIEFASELGIGIYAMKVFGGGHLGSEPEKAIQFIKNIPGIQAMALGMSSKEEIDYNLALVAERVVDPELKHKVVHRERRLFIADWCEGCGRCLSACPQSALSLSDRAEVNHEACVLCGYCGRVCPHFCLKIV